ncbi:MULTISPECIES: hypothetical protein [Burkholderiaceae]|uniref:hypothetical protein n=1 Tax=Burkholderiaceae TaxID=119060 RepID=UPI001F03D728|nr:MULTISPECIES: hypothetical protein [Burkholderiaceae]
MSRTWSYHECALSGTIQTVSAEIGASVDDEVGKGKDKGGLGKLAEGRQRINRALTLRAGCERNMTAYRINRAA